MPLNIIDEHDLLEMLNKWFSDRKIFEFGFSVSKSGGENIQYSESAVPEMENQIAELEDDIEDLEFQVDSLEEEVNDLEDDNERLRKELAKANKEKEEE